MTLAHANASDLATGKGSTDENFPVASVLIAPRHRPVVLAFYDFARVADDVADSDSAEPDAKLDLLEAMRASLVGESQNNREGVVLRRTLAEHGLTDQHALDLLEAFRRDVTKLRYDDWADLMDYCRYSASPVGRFVLDVHSEDRALWPMNDALCNALQVINHLQDCGKDRRNLDRIYVPLDRLAAAGIGVEALDAAQASPALRGVIADLARQTWALLEISRPFARKVKDGRLALEIGVIQALAEDLCRGLMTKDPLSQTVHHSKPRMALLALGAMARTGLSRLGGRA
ncbi:MAG TPA: squalene synthase HpnC [Caulobacteraceae bacterium]|nr:squalene synthase HpnC [Caulobacteraceae bacterium]